MLNSCYKVLATVMSLRTEKILDDLIDPDQTGFMSGRYICDNIRLLMDTLHYCNAEQIKGAIIMLDLEKAYDRVDHEWVFKSLKEHNFGENFAQIFDKVTAALDFSEIHVKRKLKQKMKPKTQAGEPARGARSARS